MQIDVDPARVEGKQIMLPNPAKCKRDTKTGVVGRLQTYLCLLLVKRGHQGRQVCFEVFNSLEESRGLFHAFLKMQDQDCYFAAARTFYALLTWSSLLKKPLFRKSRTSRTLPPAAKAFWFLTTWLMRGFIWFIFMTHGETGLYIGEILTFCKGG